MADCPDSGPSGLTVVIPCYNYARFLCDSLDSVLQQTYPGIEIIVVDDGSTDNTREVAATYGKRIRYIYQTNAGLPAARNTGICNATKPFIGFLDADDRWLPHMAATIMSQFTMLSDDYVLVAGHAQKMNVGGTPLPLKQLGRSVPCELSIKELIMCTPFSPSAVIVKRRVFDRSGLFDATLRSSEDRDMWIRIGACGRVFLLPEVVILYRDHPGSMSKHAVRMKANTGQVLRHAYDSGLVSRWNLWFWLKVYSFRNFQSAWMFADQGDSGKAIFEMLISILLWPIYLDHTRFNEPLLFRLRALYRYGLSLLHRQGGTHG